MKSTVHKLGGVRFPEFNSERHYMIPFTQADGLPSHLRHWQATVDSMLSGLRFDGNAYLMIDQRRLESGQIHRRPGPHVDNYWHPGISAHGGGGGYPGHRPSLPPGHRPAPGHRSWAAAWNDIPPVTPETPTWNGVPIDAFYQESILLASSHLGAVGYAGAVRENPGEGGDCSHFGLDGMDRVALTPGICWGGDTASMVHESIPVMADCFRAVVRINIPVGL